MDPILVGLLWGLDSALVVALVWLAWRCLASSDLSTAIVLFISFGLVMAIVWARLDAPDVALAEAAIGAGVTGALLLAVLGTLGEKPSPRESEEGDDGS